MKGWNDVDIKEQAAASDRLYDCAYEWTTEAGDAKSVRVAETGDQSATAHMPSVRQEEPQMPMPETPALLLAREQLSHILQAYLKRGDRQV